MSFQRFNRADDIVENQRTTVTSGLWTGGGTSVTSFFTASTQGIQSASYVEIYNANPASDSSAEVQFSLGYAHYAGSGSVGNSTKTTVGDRQSAAMYSQFKNYQFILLIMSLAIVSLAGFFLSKEKYFKYVPAINSSPKTPEL